MLSNVFAKALWDARRSMIGWTLAVAGVGALYAAFWPVVDTPEMADAISAMPADMLAAFNYNDLTTAAGYLGGSVYGLLVPLLIVVFMVAAGTRAIAGDEEAGTLDLPLAYPVGRLQLALQRYAAILVGLVAVVAVLLLIMLAIRVPAQLDSVPVANLAAMNLQLVLFGAGAGALAFAVGAATGSRSWALGLGAGVAVLGYLANSVLPMATGLEWTQNLSPWHWYLGGDPLVNGLQPANCLLLLAATIVLVAAGTWRFTARDIAV
jgi:ABC-2 type transport system permease protein